MKRFSAYTRLCEASATKPESILWSFSDTVTRQDPRAEAVGVLHLVDEPPVDLTPQHARKGYTSGYHTLHAFGVDPQNGAFVYIFTNTYRWSPSQGNWSKTTAVRVPADHARRLWVAAAGKSTMRGEWTPAGVRVVRD